MSERAEKLVFIATHGPDDPERATLPFVIANAARVMEVEAVVILQGAAVYLATKGIFEHIYAAGLPPFKDLLTSFMEQDGTLLVCTPCIKERHIEVSQLVEGAQIIAAARVVDECLEATNVLSY